MRLSYPAFFYPEENGAITVDFPDLPGCITYGYGLEDAIRMACEAASLWIEVNTERGNPLPSPSSLDAIEPDPDMNEFITDKPFSRMLELDADVVIVSSNLSTAHA